MTSLDEYRLRPLEERDLPQALTWRNLDRVRMYMYSDHLISWEEHEAWFKKAKESQRYIPMILEWRSTQVGYVNFTDIDRRNGKTTWGFYLGEEGLPMATGLAMGYRGLEYVFEVLEMRKLCGEVLAFNISSIRFHQKLGFKEEGHLVKHVLKNVDYQDVLLFALLREDWPEVKTKLGGSFHEAGQDR